MIKVGIIDSGVTLHHPHVGRVAGGASFAATSTDLVDRLGHGTAVAGVISELASDVELYILKVFDRRLTTNIRSVLEAIEWCQANSVDVINLSLGTENEKYRDQFARQIGKGSLVVSAAHSLPGSLPEAIGVIADSACERGTYHYSEGFFYTSPHPRPIPGVPQEHNFHGVSFAVANMSGIVASKLRYCQIGHVKEILANGS